MKVLYKGSLSVVFGLCKGFGIRKSVSETCMVRSSLNSAWRVLLLWWRGGGP